MTAPVGFTEDANTLALYRFNEATTAANAVDEVANTYPLTPVGTGTHSIPGVLNARQRTCGGASTNYFQRGSHDAALLTAVGTARSLTVEALIYPRTVTGQNLAVQTICSFGGPSNSGASTNFGFWLYLIQNSGGSTKRLVFFHQHTSNASTNALVQSANDAVTWDALNYVVGVREWTGSQYNLYIYVNGVLVGTLLNATAPSGGSNTNRLAVGATYGFTSQECWADYSELRLSNVARSAGDIAATYAAMFPSAVTFPGAPTIGTATAGNTNVAVTWTAPASDGGSAITGYTVTSSPGGFTAAAGGGATSATVYGLTNGTAYTFTVKATNAQGDSSASSASNSVTPAGVPGIPTSVAATPGDGTAVLTWLAPASNGGSAITGYRVTKSPGGTTTTLGVVLGTTISGLTNGEPYAFTVAAINAIGTGAESAAAVSSDDTAPVVTLVSPAEASAFTKQQEIVIAIADSIALRRSFLWAVFAPEDDTEEGDWEVIHDGVTFAPKYSRSFRTLSGATWTYTIRRSRGWPQVPTLEVLAIDRAGNEAA